MANFNNVIITAKGLALNAKTIEGKCNIAFTKMCASDETITNQNVINLNSIKQTSVIASVVRQNETNVKVNTVFDNTSLTAGYYVQTIGLYALDPQEGEILYCYATADIADFMPSYNGIGTSSLLVDIVIGISNTDNVDLTVTPSAYATVTQIAELQKEIAEVKGYIGYGYENVWGVEVDYANNKITRIAAAKDLNAGADFDNLKPWMRRRCMVGEDGIVEAYFGEDGYSEEGYTTASKHSPQGTPVNIMVEQPVFYTKVVPVFYEDAVSGAGKQIVKANYYISEYPLEGFKVNDVFKDANGNVQDKIYLAAYEGSASKYDLSEDNINGYKYYLNDEQVIDFNDSKFELRSVANAKPMSGLSQNLSIKNARTIANNFGNGWCLHNIFALAVTQILMLVEYASFDCKTNIGTGVGLITDDGSSNQSVMTGYTSVLGNSSGMALLNGLGDSVQCVDGKLSVSYRGEENLWGNINTWLDGINVEHNGMNNAYIGGMNINCESNTKTNYNEFEARLSHKTGYVSRFGYDRDYDYLFLPTESNGSSRSLVGSFFNQDYARESDDLAPVSLGGNWSTSNANSLWLINTHLGLYSHSRMLGCRLLYVPQS